MDIYADLAAEEDRLAAVLEALTPEQWAAPSRCSGWNVADVVLHLAQTEEAVRATVGPGEGDLTPTDWSALGDTVEEAMGAYVERERSAGLVVLERWQRARRAALDALRGADPDRRVQWVTTTLKPATLATTRLAEHWTHALDVTEPLGIPYPHTDRLRHLAWLALATLPYAYAARSRTAPSVRADLLAPSGERWSLGPDDAQVTVRGPASQLCLVAAQRLDPADIDLETDGEGGEEVLRLIRTFAV